MELFSIRIQRTFQLVSTIYEMNKVSSDEERINSYGKEYFFNLGDRFERKLKIGL
jgi:hypothetical protein